MIEQEPNETRIEMLLRVLDEFAIINSGICVEYDESYCDMYYLADEIRIEVEDLLANQVAA